LGADAARTAEGASRALSQDFHTLVAPQNSRPQNPPQAIEKV